MNKSYLVTCFSILLAAPALAQQAAPACDSLSELTQEVRQLRQVVQRAAESVSHGQILMERLRLQQARVASAESAIERQARQVADLAVKRHELASMTGLLQNELGTANPDLRRSLEAQMRMQESRLQLLTREEQTLSEQQTKLAIALQNEQDTLQSIMRELSDLIRRR